jgi:hypothetical protein
MREHTCNSQEYSLWYHAFTLNGRQFQTVVVADVRKVDRPIMGRVPKDRVAVCEGVGARRGEARGRSRVCRTIDSTRDTPRHDTIGHEYGGTAFGERQILGQAAGIVQCVVGPTADGRKT